MSSLFISHTDHATNFAYWTGWAHSHLQHAELLRVDKQGIFNETHRIETAGMLYGLSLENLVKGAWVKNNPTMATRTEKGVKRLAKILVNHDLTILLSAIGVSLDDEEEGLRKILEGCVRRGYPTYDYLTDDNDAFVCVGDINGINFICTHEAVFTGLMNHQEEQTIAELQSIFNKVMKAGQLKSQLVFATNGNTGKKVFHQLPWN